MSNNLVSVIITCHGKANFIAKSVKSIINQTYQNIEIIMANDGDNDPLLLRQLDEIKSKSKDITVKTIITNNNRGVSHCRNQCIEIAEGDYIFTLDGDDFTHSEYLTKCVQILDNDINSQLVYSLVIMFNAEKNWPKIRILAKDHENLIAAAYIPSAHMFRKSDWIRVGGYNEKLLKGEEDWDFNIKRILPDKKFVRINEYFMFYRQTNNSRQKEFDKSLCSKFTNDLIIMQNNIDIFRDNIEQYYHHQKVKTKIIRKIFALFYLYFKYAKNYFFIIKILREYI